MRTLVLSDHTHDQATAAASKRQADYARALGTYESALAHRAGRSQALIATSRQYFKEGRYFAWLASIVARMVMRFSAPLKAPVIAAAGRDEVVWNAGGDGEQRALDALARQLGDEWVAISGYRNPAGEIDLLLVGPDGVVAIEVKYVNGKVHCEGDRWWRDKSDKYGNVVERNLPITDKKGRGPSAQVNAAASRLQGFLAERTPVRSVLRAVVLSHDQSELGVLQSPTVHAIARLRDFDPGSLVHRILGAGHQLLVDDLVRIITQDHRYHERRTKPKEPR
ncbi:nuclease-related domain-containing protein [Rhodoferax sp. GW822-FHT02A01]|uniref:nuclease-related domain-containing protein n=1 Tax=Rhodoferax sp. GW822-FHT02A01 TaxID=3141537 RepID=UPI00315DF51B